MKSASKTLDDVCEFIVDCLHATAPTQDAGYALIRTPNIGKGRLVLDGVYRVSENTYKKWTRRAVPRANDLVLAREAPAGNVAVIKDGQDVCLGQRTVHLRPDQSQADSDFLCYFMLTPYQQGMLLAGETGATSKHVNMKDIRRLPLENLPPLEVQRRVGQVLSAYDDMIENNRRRIQLLEEAARLLYKEWFVHLRFPGHEHVSVIDGVPEGWEPGTIANIGSIVTGKTPSKKRESYYGGSVPFIKTPDMHGNTVVCKTEESLTEEGAESQANKTLPPRSLLVSCIGTVGAVAFNASNAQTNQQINAIVPKAEASRYWSFFMAKTLKPLLEGMGGGATMANVNKSKFSSIPVVIPSQTLLQQFNSIAKSNIDQIERLELMGSPSSLQNEVE